ncbi:MAG: hypothetical protein ABSD47_03860 [Candidatus Methylomirabilota bacterium]|jgi:GMP synthase (glutamine-hydrolysing)
MGIREIKVKGLDPKVFIKRQVEGIRLDKLAKRIATQVKGVVSVTYNITPKPPSTIEAV